MNKQFHYLLAALVAITILFTNCKKEPEEDLSIIEATNVLHILPAHDEIATVKAVTLSYGNNQVIATSNYIDHSFRMELPKTLDDSYLDEFSFRFPRGINVSDTTAKTVFIRFEAYNKDGYSLDNIKYGSIKSNITSQYVYTDREFTIMGKNETHFPYKSEYACSFKKGWNIIYYVYVINNEIQESVLSTTTKPTNVELVWYFGF